MKRRLLFSFALAGLAVASAKSYTVNLYSPATVGNTELKPGEYKVEVVDQKAVIRNGKIESEAPVKVETGDVKYNTTSVRFSNDDGKMHIQEIHIGGTRTKLVFNE
ncbi:MAG: hypothetical protein LAQ69_16535 [Acidobacteriia bacterium]|nr:hypothetical protein [Terriglobia bacterium]